jgi:hypothetical protein
VATKLTLGKYPADQVEIVNAFIAEEHPDNRRFLADCERLPIAKRNRFGGIRVVGSETGVSGQTPELLLPE